MKVEDLHPSQFTYELPEYRIAKYPLKDRSDSKLLLYNHGSIRHLDFQSVLTIIPDHSLLVFNNTKVIPARLKFQKSTGARIEVFLLEPIRPDHVLETAMNAKNECRWDCMIGNAKKWTAGTILELKIDSKVSLRATRSGEQEVTFYWNGDLPFAEILSKTGQTPLPPYINREPEKEDHDRYQTVYSAIKGAVAAPTAGLHFTTDILENLKEKHTLDHVTLHVSAGTFQPITSTVGDHAMHREQIIIEKSTIENLIKKDSVIAVGTTSMRTLESLFWYGVELQNGKEEFSISKLLPYQSKTVPVRNQSLESVLEYMDKNNLEKLTGHTELFIAPGYDFKICDGLSTNFHMPGSTLLMLVAAFIGSNWKKLYQEAMEHDYRFLSYGDTSLLFP